MKYKKILNKLIKKNYSFSVAESCTGGRISSEITKIPGSSKVFYCGIIAYSNESKIKLLKINKKKLLKFGAVSKEISIEMAKNLLKITKNDFCISTTGISGPTGSTRLKKIGLTYICLYSKRKKIVYKKIFKGNRITIQKKITNFVFNIINKNT